MGSPATTTEEYAEEAAPVTTEVPEEAIETEAADEDDAPEEQITEEE